MLGNIRKKLAMAAVAALVATSALAAAGHPAGAALPVGSPAYWTIGAGGQMLGFGTAAYGDMSGQPLNRPVVGGAASLDGAGYWLVAADGGVFSFGSAAFHGSAGGQSLPAPVVAMAPDPATGGYWLVTANGKVLNFDAPYYGGADLLPLHQPIVGMAPTPSGGGYWLVASDGGVFSFGNAGFYGSTGLMHLNAPIVGMAPTPSGGGYWLVASDGGVFSFGNAGFHGSTGNLRLVAPVTGMAASPSGGGYWLVGRDGGIFTFGDARFLGSAFGETGSSPVVGIASTPYGRMLPPNSTGYDVSQYQCPAYNGGTLPSGAHSFGVVQASGGYIENYQPAGCYAEEAGWAGPNLMAYIFMDPLPGPGADKAMSGPAGNCAQGDSLCQAYNYGYNWAQNWVGYARAQGTEPVIYFLDVEVGVGWAYDSASQAQNSREITGAVDGIRALGAVPGFYSTNYQWNLITGGQVSEPGIALWMAGATDQAQAAAFCSGDYSPDYQAFAGGKVVMAQWVATYDEDYACP